MKTRHLSVLLLLCLGSLFNPAQAGEVKVLTAGAFKTVLLSLVPAFEQQTGHKVTVDNDTAGGLVKRVSGGEAFDLVVLPPAGQTQLGKEGKVTLPYTALARAAIGVAIKQGSPVPDISSVAAFQNTLLAAKAVAYIDPAAGGSSGIYLTQWFEKVGIADRIRPKAVLVPGGLVAERVVNGQADIAMQQISELIAVPGAQLVGPIPAEIQNYTVYAGSISTQVRDAAAAQALLRYLASPAAQAMLKDKGMEAAK